MPKYKLSEVREKYLKFHQSKGHTIVPSSSLVPKEDPTVLFNTAGMQPMIPYLTGQATYPDGVTRIANSQICIRTDDIDEVGDNRHCTFFEMLGNWSLNDYFKKEIIPWSLEFMSSKDWLNLDLNRIFVTAYRGNESQNLQADTESIELWKSSYLNNGFDGEISVSDEFNFKKFNSENVKLSTPDFSETKYIVLDFDGVIADSRNFYVDLIFKNQAAIFGQDSKLTKGEVLEFIYNRFSVPKSDTHVSLAPLLQMATELIHEKTKKIPVFKDFIAFLASLKNTKFAIVTDNTVQFVKSVLEQNAFTDLGLQVDEILGYEVSHSKIEKMNVIANKWGVDIKKLYYITDTLRDKLELEETIPVSNIFVKFDGFCKESTILKSFHYANILFKPSDILSIYLPKLGEVFTSQEIKNLNLIARIRKLSGKDNWWGLPYEGPCGPCSEMYYLLNHNDVNFQDTIFPLCTINQVEDFIENQIIEVGNNVFMMYNGSKDDQKEPIGLSPLNAENVDTGLGLERFVVAINGFSTVYDLDIYQETLAVIDKYSS